MKLSEVPRNTKIRVLEDPLQPPASISSNEGDIVTFHNLDGMYSCCTNEAGEIIHLYAFTEVEIITPKSDGD